MQNNLLRRSGATLLASFLAVAAAGYDIITENGYPVKWSNGTVTFQVKVGSATTLQDGTNYSTSFVAALEAWNAVLGNLQFAGNISTEAAPTTAGNGVNEAFFAANIFGEAFGDSTVAVTTSYRSTTLVNSSYYRRTQSDIVFNNSRTWNSYRGATQTGIIDFRRVALHELGHVLGLDHPDEATPVQTVPRS